MKCVIDKCIKTMMQHHGSGMCGYHLEIVTDLGL